MKKKKILQISPVLTIGGAEKVVRDIAYYADSSEFEMHLLILKDEVGIYEQQLLEKGCKAFHVPEPSENYFDYLRSLLQIMKRERYDAVHAHTMFSCGWVMLAARLAGVPVRVTHAHSALHNGSSLVKSIYEWVMRLLIVGCATDLVACGKAAGERLFGKRAFEKRGQLILNGVDVENFRFDSQKRQTMRQQLGLENSFVIGHAGHLAKVKNQKFLIDLMPLILKKRPDARLILLGEGDDRPMLEEKIREMGLQGQVRLTGNVTNVAEYLCAMDVFAFPSLFEGMPLSIIEVQANGLPCVISTGVPEDVFLTDLICPLSLEAPKEEWVNAICGAVRRDAGKYADELKTAGFDTSVAMEKIYGIYSKGISND